MLDLDSIEYGSQQLLKNKQLTCTFISFYYHHVLQAFFGNEIRSRSDMKLGRNWRNDHPEFNLYQDGSFINLTVVFLATSLRHIFSF